MSTDRLREKHQRIARIEQRKNEEKLAVIASLKQRISELELE